MSANAARTRRYKARIAPRSDGGGASRIRWDKVARIALVVVLFLVLASYVKPALNVVNTWREAGVADQRVLELQAENDRLTQLREQLSNRASELREARRSGLVAAGEQSYKLEGLK